jgi:tRNA A37 threonylcarbamoyladenosine synthetase subunit TsaC/SUA5/YrdC
LAFGGTITATSCNVTGQEPAMTAAAARAVFGNRVTILDGGPAGGGAPSTVARVDREGTLTILRAGAIDPSHL